MGLPIALTMGEPAGICGELTLKAWAHCAANHSAPFYVIGDPDYYKSQALDLGLNVNIAEIASPDETANLFSNFLPVLPLHLPKPAQAGNLDTGNAQSVIDSIALAVSNVKTGQASAVVTNPIHKSVLYDIGFTHPGHTEYLAELAGNNEKSVMMLACEELRVIPVTIHVSLAKAVQTLSSNEIVNVSRVTAKSLEERFGIKNPRLGIAALNPHAGEDGAMGDEEISIIQPAVDQLRAEGINASDPLPADTLFHEVARKNWDAVICMYHDQALIPLKTIDFSGGVNITLGLPFIRTSPDHGTALDIAGQGNADPASLIYALKQAEKMVIYNG